MPNLVALIDVSVYFELLYIVAYTSIYTPENICAIYLTVFMVVTVPGGSSVLVMASPRSQSHKEM